MRIIETSAFPDDIHPAEKFVNLPRMRKEDAEALVGQINELLGGLSGRTWKAVENDYVLKSPAVIEDL